MKDNSEKEIFLQIIGVILIAIGIICNKWLVTYFFTYDNNLSTTAQIMVWTLDLISIGLGVLIILYRNKIKQYLSFSKKSFLSLIAVIVFMFISLEISARIIDKIHGHSFTFEKQHEERPFIPFRTFGSNYYKIIEDKNYISSRHKELYPFQKEENTIRIVTFGGSTTQQSVDGVHYPLILEKLLSEKYPNKKIEVINIGNSAYATPHAIILLSLDVLSWDPDIIILSHNVNDLLVSYFPNFALDYSNKYSHNFYTKPTNQSSPLDFIYEWSTLYWIIAQQLKAMDWKEIMGENFHLTKSYGKKPTKVAQDVFERNLITFINIAKQQNIKVILGTQPLETDYEYWELHTRWKPYNDEIIYPLHEELISHHNKFNSIIKSTAQNQKIFVVDNDNIFNGEKDYFIDYVHYTKKGLQKLAENYYNYIVNNGLIWF